MDKALILKYLQQTLCMADENAKTGNGGPFAAIILRDGEVIAEGVNIVTKANDPTAHAEVLAIRNACKKLKHFSLEGCIIISSCEPCPMCLAAIYWARLDKIFYAAGKNDAANAGFDDDFIYNELRFNPDYRKMASEQIKVENYFKPFETWINMEGKVDY
jgi:tRNA(Arg) A34 adenosine deaminase TadA